MICCAGVGPHPPAAAGAGAAAGLAFFWGGAAIGGPAPSSYGLMVTLIPNSVTLSALAALGKMWNFAALRAQP